MQPKKESDTCIKNKWDPFIKPNQMSNLRQCISICQGLLPLIVLIRKKSYLACEVLTRYHPSRSRSYHTRLLFRSNNTDKRVRLYHSLSRPENASLGSFLKPGILPFSHPIQRKPPYVDCRRRYASFQCCRLIVPNWSIRTLTHIDGVEPDRFNSSIRTYNSADLWSTSSTSQGVPP